MIYGDDWLFIHNPKCAGTSIKQWLCTKSHTAYRPMHVVCQDLAPEYYTGRWVFGFVRNPWSRMASMYEFTKKRLMQHPEISISSRHEFDWTFKRWLLEGAFYEDDYGIDYLPPHQRRSQSYWLEMCDYIGQVERFDTATHIIAGHIHVPPKYVKVNVNNHTDWQNYYDDETNAHIEKYFGWEIDKYGYTNT